MPRTLPHHYSSVLARRNQELGNAEPLQVTSRNAHIYWYTRHANGSPRHIFMLPQLQYGREVDEVTWFTMNAVMFITRIPHLPGYWDFGLPIAHIYDGARFFELDSLVGAADLIDFGARNKITHRLEILVAGPNPRITFERQVSACRFTRNPEPLTLSTAARHIARTIWVCIQSYGGQWTLQDGTVVRYEDLVLLELVQISEGSHQIVLAYLQPRICIPTPVAESHQRTWGAGTVSLQGGCSFRETSNGLIM